MRIGCRFCCALSIIAVFLLHNSLLSAYPEGWSDDVLLTPETSGYRHYSDISIDSYNNVWVVWDSNFWGNGYVYYSKWDSLGNCIIPETPLPDPLHSSFGQTKVVVDNSDNVHIQWTEPSPTGNGIGYAKLDNVGSIIVNPHLAMPGYGNGGQYRHEIALDKYQNINIVWVEMPSATGHVSYTKLDSLGDTLISRIQVSSAGVSALAPGIGVDSMANVHMAYRTDTTGISLRLTYSKLDRYGNILINNNTLGFGYGPVIICDRSQHVHMVYGVTTSSGIDIRYLKLDQAGNFIVSPKTISLYYDNNNYPHMAMDSLQYLHVVWHLESPMGIMYTKLDTVGNYVISPVVIVYPPHAIWPGFPRITVDRSNRLHVVWTDQRLGSEDVYYKRGENETGIEERMSWGVGDIRLTACPNPFKNVTAITYEITTDCSIELLIYDICGRLVRDLTQQQSTVGDLLSVSWDGTDNQGNLLPAGVYFVRIQSSRVDQSVPVVLLR